MKTVIAGIVILLFSFGVVSTVSANCADDAIDTCNEKHPEPDKSDHAYDLYELCIKAQIGQNCPNSATGNATIKNVQKARKGMVPKCSAGYTLKVDWKGKEDRCIKTSTRFMKKQPRGIDKATPRLMQPST